MDTVTTAAAAAAAVTTDARAQRRRRRAAWLAGMKAPTLAGSVPASDGIRRPGDCVRARDRHGVPTGWAHLLRGTGQVHRAAAAIKAGPGNGVKSAVPLDRMASTRPSPWTGWRHIGRPPDQIRWSGR
ncbi:hypothetical protein ACWGMA_43620 [Streptomyces asiaticus]